MKKPVIGPTAVLPTTATRFPCLRRHVQSKPQNCQLTPHLVLNVDHPINNNNFVFADDLS
jgi:hypothetical protein